MRLSVFSKCVSILFTIIVAGSPIVAGPPSLVFAQQITEQFEKPMPKVEFMPKAEFEERTNLILEESEEDLSLSFSLRVDKDWVESGQGGVGDIVLGRNVLKELKKFFGPPSLTVRSKLVIEAVGLEYDMTIEQWFSQYLLSNGYSLQGLEVYDNDNAEALYVLLDQDISYAVRSVARVNGRHVLFAQYFVPVERWHDEKVMQAQTLDSFRLGTEVKEHVEEMETYKFLDISEFKYPVTWKLRALPVRSIDRMKVELLKLAEVEGSDGKMRNRLDGQIDVEMVSIYASDTLEEEFERFREALAEKGMVLGDVIEQRDDFLLGEQYDFVDTQVYKVTSAAARLIDHELWVTIMSSGEYYYFVTLFTPARDQNFFLWARNAETYKLVTSLIKPQQDDNFAQTYEE